MNISETILNTQEKLEQLERRKILQNQRDKKRQQAIDTRRYIIIGKIVCKHFPELTRLQLGRTDEENSLVFMEFDNYVLKLAGNKIYVDKTNEEILLDN